MLISLQIENFKGVAARQRIDFAPITLLFGANSAGKSTVLQALMYLHELIERGAADVDRTVLGGDVVGLGGFARFVHQHDVARAIVLRAEFTTPGSLERLGRDLSEFPFPDLEDEVGSAWLELTIRFRATTSFRGPMVERAVVGVNGDSEPLVWLEVGPALGDMEPLQARVNLGHRLLAGASRTAPGAFDSLGDGTQSEIAVPQACVEVAEAWGQLAIPEETPHGAPESGGLGRGSGIGLRDGSGFGDGRSLPVFAVGRSRLSALPPLGEPMRVIPFGVESPEKTRAAQQVRTLLEMVVLGTTSQLAGFLRESLYVGPLRGIPGLADLYERPHAAVSWADGRAAWQALLVDRLDLVERTNAWLARLGADSRLFVASTFEPSSAAGDATSTRVHTLRLETAQRTRVLPSEVGAGVSQVLPVVVAALLRRGGMLAIEQPELHVHPALQVGLGDLFIDSVTRESTRRRLLIETHSEHLILRLLRRIRETTERELPERAPAFSEDRLCVTYVESTPAGVQFRRLRVDDHGEFIDRWPAGFFAERAAELF